MLVESFYSWREYWMIYCFPFLSSHDNLFLSTNLLQLTYLFHFNWFSNVFTIFHGHQEHDQKIERASNTLVANMRWTLSAFASRFAENIKVLNTEVHWHVAAFDWRDLYLHFPYWLSTCQNHIRLVPVEYGIAFQLIVMTLVITQSTAHISFHRRTS